MSSVTGYNLELLLKFLNTVPKQHPVKDLEQKSAEFQVDETYLVPDVGVVAGGILTRYRGNTVPSVCIQFIIDL